MPQCCYNLINSLSEACVLCACIISRNAPCCCSAATSFVSVQAGAALPRLPGDCCTLAKASGLLCSAPISPLPIFLHWVFTLCVMGCDGYLAGHGILSLRGSWWCWFALQQQYFVCTFCSLLGLIFLFFSMMFFLVFVDICMTFSMRGNLLIQFVPSVWLMRC